MKSPKVDDPTIKSTISNAIVYKFIICIKTCSRMLLEDDLLTQMHMCGNVTCVYINQVKYRMNTDSSCNEATILLYTIYLLHYFADFSLSCRLAGLTHFVKM